MHITEFLNLNIEEQSLYIRDLFERAAANYSSYSSRKEGELSIVIHDDKAYLNLNDNDAQILTSYNETLFPNTKFIEMEEGVSMIQVSKETLSRYCSAIALSKIPQINQLDTENDWRSNETIIDAPDTELSIVFRGMVDTEKTASYFYCDAQAIISQQLINYQQVMLKRGIQGADLFKHLSFPVVEGRGAVFCFAGVPFHAYNARTYNDLLGEYLELYHCDYGKVYWKVDQQKLTEKGFSITPLTIGQGVSLLPEISQRQQAKDYLHVIRIPLTTYIAYSLKYQKSLLLQNRILIDEATRASDEAINQALERLNTIIGVPEQPINVARDYLFFTNAPKPAINDALCCLPRLI